jgi:LmbE family N-acetylglucosaminyl deacetylase
MDNEKSKNVAVIVAHPDDETLWSGGTILNHTGWKWCVVCLCRGSDADRVPRFYRALKVLGAEGVIGDLDDGPEQIPLTEEAVEQAILQLMPAAHFDLIISHDPAGEYTKHLRHEEIGRATITLWNQGKISAGELWTFAYEDGNKQYFPQPIKAATLYNLLPEKIWELKYKLITNEYGFEENSWEAKTTPKVESFRQFKTPSDAMHWLTKRGFR